MLPMKLFSVLVNEIAGKNYSNQLKLKAHIGDFCKKGSFKLHAL